MDLIRQILSGKSHGLSQERHTHRHTSQIVMSIKFFCAEGGVKGDGIVYYEPLKAEETVTADVCCRCRVEQLERCIVAERPAIAVNRFHNSG